MKIAQLKWCAMMVASLLASACSSVAKEAPANELFSQAMVRQVSHDNRYNFTGKAYFALEEDANDENLNAGVNELKLNEAVNLLTAVASQSDSDKVQNLLNQPSKDEKMRHILNKYGERWLGAFAVPYSGAVDLPNGRVELVPEFQMKTRLSSSTTKLPMLVDLKEGAVYADPEALTFWIDPILEAVDIPAVDNRLVALKLSAEQKNRVPLENIYKAMPTAMQRGYATLPAQAFTKMEMDEFGKQAKAVQRIRSNLNLNDYVKVGETSLQALRDELAQQGSQSGVSAEDYQKTLNFLDEMLKHERELTEKLAKLKSDSTSKTRDDAQSDGSQKPSLAEQIANADKRKHDNEAFASVETIMSDVEKAEAKANDKTLEFVKTLRSIRVVEDVYLDRKGRLVAKRSKMMLPAEWDKDVAKLLGKPKSLRLYADSQIVYSRQPVFTVVPNENNVFDLSCVLRDIKQCEWAKAKEQEALKRELSN